MFHVEHPAAPAGSGVRHSRGQPLGCRDEPGEREADSVATHRPMTTPETERRQVADRIARRANRAGLQIDSLLQDALAAYLDLLLRWNRRINLTALTDDDPGIDRLVIEPLVAARRLPMPDAVVTDIGSGGGSPAVPMKLAAPAVRLRMVESRTRKAAFLREVVRRLRLEQTTVEACRYEELAARQELAGQSGVVSVRAVRTGARMLDRIEPLVKDDGLVFLFGSTRGSVDAIPPPWRVDAAYPLLDPASRLVVLRKRRR